MSPGEDLPETSREREKLSTMEEMITSFKNKINKMEKKSKIPYTRPFIVSRSDTLTETVQSHQRPSILSIGPLHRGDANLQIMEEFKWSLLYISNFGSLSSDELSVCFLALKELEDQSRRTYSVIVDVTSDEFVQMLFLDACFFVLLVLAELELYHTLEEQKTVRDMPAVESSLSKLQTNLLSVPKVSEILTKLKLLDMVVLDADVTTDMMILDNQIPFLILEYMWKWFLERLDVESPLDFIECLSLIYPSETASFPEKIHHFLHFLYCGLIPPQSETCELYDRYYRPWIPSATELKESGIKFKLENPGDHLSLEITFNDGVIHISETFLTEYLRTLTENLLDFEQSLGRGHSTAISNYVWIMSCLLSKEDDVRILSLQSSFKYEKGWDKDVQRFFHNLEKRCSYWMVDDEIRTLFSRINVYRLSRRRRWKAIFQRKLCSNPWITLSITGAIILFILTFVQTFFAIYSYLRPPSG